MSLLAGTVTTQPFRVTGIRPPLLFKSSKGAAGTHLPDLGVGRQYGIHSITCAATVVSTASPGQVITHSYFHVRHGDTTPAMSDPAFDGATAFVELTIPVGGTVYFPAPILWPESKSIFTEAGAYMTIVYEILGG